MFTTYLSLVFKSPLLALSQQEVAKSAHPLHVNA
jgi:hypothetical protein